MKLKTKLATLLLGITSIFALTAAIVTNPNSGNAIEAKAEDVKYSFTITKDDFNSKSYADNNIVHTSTAQSLNDSAITKEIEWKSNQVMLQKSAMQWQKNAGCIYNITDLGTISSVQIDSTAGSFTTYYGTSENPSSGTDVGGGFFNVKVGSATGKTSKIIVTFTINESSEPSSEPSISSVSINETNNIIKLSSSKTLTATVNADEGFAGDKNVTWSSSDETVATVDSSTGVVTGVKTGKATITATSVADTTKTDSVDVLVLNNSGLTVEDPLTVSEAIDVIDTYSTATGYITGIISTIESYNSTYKSLTYWLDNDTFEIYSGKGLNGADFSSVDDLKIGSEVVLYGDLKKFNTTYELDKNNFIVSYNEPADLVLESIQISGTPNKLEYYTGEEFSVSGLTVSATYSNGIVSDVTNKVAWTINPSILTLDTVSVSVTATFEEKTSTITIDNVVVTEPKSKIVIDLSKNYLTTCLTDKISWDYGQFSVNVTKGSSTNANNYYGGDNSSHTSTRFYKGATLTIKPNAGYSIYSVIFNATSTDYASALASSTWSNATAKATGSEVTINPIDTNSDIVAKIGGTTGNTKITVECDYDEAFDYQLLMIGNANSCSTTKKNWQNLKTRFSCLSIENQNILKTTTYTSIDSFNDSDEISAEHCVARYDAVIIGNGTTSYEDFMERFSASGIMAGVLNANPMNLINNGTKTIINSEASIVSIVFVLISGLTLCGVVVYRKKQ